MPMVRAVLPAAAALPEPRMPELAAPKDSWPAMAAQTASASQRKDLMWQATQFDSPRPRRSVLPPSGENAQGAEVIAAGSGGSMGGNPEGGNSGGIVGGNAPDGPGIASLSANGNGAGYASPWGDGGPVLLAAGPDPVYPPAEVRKHTEGVVRVRMTVGEDGHVREAVVIVSSGSAGLDQSALAAARQRCFKAVGSGPGEVHVEQSFRFSLL